MSRRIPYTSFVPIVIALNCVFTVFVAMLESGICDYSSYPNETWAALDNYDMQTAFYREESDLPFRLAVLECLIGLCTLIIPASVTAMGDLIPGTIIIILVVVRVHSTGALGCYETDHTCCPALNCPQSDITSFIEGCGEGDLIYWRNANNFCPIPAWYINYRNTCLHLAHAPNYVPCHVYGCSYSTTPLRYIANRVWAVLSLLSIIGFVRNMVTVNLLKLGTIRVIKLKEKT